MDRFRDLVTRGRWNELSEQFGTLKTLLPPTFEILVEVEGTEDYDAEAVMSLGYRLERSLSVHDFLLERLTEGEKRFRVGCCMLSARMGTEEPWMLSRAIAVLLKELPRQPDRAYGLHALCVAALYVTDPEARMEAIRYLEPCLVDGRPDSAQVADEIRLVLKRFGGLRRSFYAGGLSVVPGTGGLSEVAAAPSDHEDSEG